MNSLEERILRLYDRCGVRSPKDISLHIFDQVLPIQVIYRYGPAVSAVATGDFHIFVDGHLSIPERRELIAHEIGHILLHSGIQSWMPPRTRSKQEWQAKRFAAYALAPSPMIVRAVRGEGESIDRRMIETLSEIFGVTHRFMEERLAFMKRDNIKFTCL